MTALARTGAPGRHRGGEPAVLLPSPPAGAERLCYLDRHRTYLTLVVLIGSSSILASQFALEAKYGLWFLTPYTVYAGMYAAIALSVHSAGRNFSGAAHHELTAAWYPPSYPAVDIYLPVCGEPVEVIRNTWVHVFELVQAYPGAATPWVLDDAADPAVKEMAADFGFTYLVRPDRGRMRKAGNMRHAFSLTTGEFIAVFDADFTPRPDFLTETLPYFGDAALGILQTPQFFRTDMRQTWVERAGNAVQEVFYRNIQVARDRYGASVCCGTCAVYRRAALEGDGGFAEVPYAEDEHTGLNARERGWRVRYIPVALASGMSPATVDGFVRQQYRWCSGTFSTLRRWPAVPLRGKLMYASGLFYYLYSASMLFIGPLVPSLLLLLIPTRIHPRDYLLLAPAVINGMVLYPVWHKCGFGPSTWPLAVVRSWAHFLAIIDYARGRTMQWQVTGSGASPVKRLWVGLTVWNGGTALAWLALAGLRIAQYGITQFWIITMFGLLYAGITGFILLSRRSS